MLRIIAKYHWLAFTLAFFKPVATINGHEIKLNWGQNDIPAPPGVHQITIHIPYMWKFGQATLNVDNTTGTPTIHYAAPVWTFGGGNIGYEPQKHPGLVAQIVLLSVVFGALFLCCCGSALLNMLDS